MCSSRGPVAQRHVCELEEAAGLTGGERTGTPIPQQRTGPPV